MGLLGSEHAGASRARPLEAGTEGSALTGSRPADHHISPTARLDHLVVVAPTLGAGAASVRSALGADPRPGGWHDRMGTHNVLLRLGPDVYLEVIAIDPAARPPGRVRWFG